MHILWQMRTCWLQVFRCFLNATSLNNILHSLNQNDWEKATFLLELLCGHGTAGLICISHNKRSYDSCRSEKGSFLPACVSQWVHSTLLHALLYNDSQVSSHKHQIKNTILFFCRKKGVRQFPHAVRTGRLQKRELNSMLQDCWWHRTLQEVM